MINITVCSSNGFKIYHAKINDLQKNFFATPTSLMSQLAKYKEDTFVHPQQKMKWFMNTRFPCEMQWPEKYIFWYLEISICWSMCFVVLYISDARRLCCLYHIIICHNQNFVFINVECNSGNVVISFHFKLDTFCMNALGYTYSDSHFFLHFCRLITKMFCQMINSRKKTLFNHAKYSTRFSWFS